MDTLRQLGGGLLLAAFSAALVVGGISLALAESYVPVVPTPTETQSPIPSFPSPTFPSLAFVTETIPPSPSPTETIPPPISCPPPPGWVAISVGPGEDLVTLAFRYQSTPEALLLANCLFSTDLPTGSILYVPPHPTPNPGALRPAIRLDPLQRAGRQHPVQPKPGLWREPLPTPVCQLHGGQPVQPRHRPNHLGAKRGHAHTPRHRHGDAHPGRHRLPHPDRDGLGHTHSDGHPDLDQPADGYPNRDSHSHALPASDRDAACHCYHHRFPHPGWGPLMGKKYFCHSERPQAVRPARASARDGGAKNPRAPRGRPFAMDFDMLHSYSICRSG